MKKIVSILTCIIICLSFASCGSKKHDIEYSVGLYSLFGESIEIIEKTIDFEDAQCDTIGNEKTYSFECNNNDFGVTKKKLNFYNDVLYLEQTDFDNIEDAFFYASNYRRDFDLNYGEKDTYPMLVSQNLDFFDNITGVEYLKNGFTYYEYYTVTVSDKKTDVPWLYAEKADKLTGDRKYSRMDMRLELKINSENSASVIVKYDVLP